MDVLVVDDEKLIVDDLIRDVKEVFPSGTSADGAVNAFEALKLASAKQYDVAILDIDLPQMDGITLARRLISSNPLINIIFVTGYSEFALEAHELYCSAFLVKPVGTRKLKKAFENLRRPFVDITKDISVEYYTGGSEIGKRIEAIRTQRGMKRQELADLMGVTRQTVYRWEQGDRMPDILTFIKLTRILGVHIEDIIGRR